MVTTSATQRPKSARHTTTSPRRNEWRACGHAHLRHVRVRHGQEGIIALLYLYIRLCGVFRSACPSLFLTELQGVASPHYIFKLIIWTVWASDHICVVFLRYLVLIVALVTAQCGDRNQYLDRSPNWVLCWSAGAATTAPQSRVVFWRTSTTSNGQTRRKPNTPITGAV